MLYFHYSMQFFLGKFSRFHQLCFFFHLKEKFPLHTSQACPSLLLITDGTHSSKRRNQNCSPPSSKYLLEKKNIPLPEGTRNFAGKFKKQEER